MGKKAVDDRSLTALADALRECSEERGELVFPEGFVGAVYAGHAQAYEQGHEDGVQLCTENHFLCNFVGDGSGSRTFRIPFEPDMIQIVAFDPALQNTPGSLAMVICDVAAFGMVGGIAYYGSATGGIANVAYTTTSVHTRYAREADGTVVIGNIGGTAADIVFAAGFPYTAIAVRYVEQTDKERITAFVNRLTGSGKVTLNQKKVTAAFSDDEWAALIASKPNWTFNWI